MDGWIAANIRCAMKIICPHENRNEMLSKRQKKTTIIYLSNNEIHTDEDKRKMEWRHYRQGSAQIDWNIWQSANNKIASAQSSAIGRKTFIRTARKGEQRQKKRKKEMKINRNCRKWDRSPELTLARQFSLIPWRLCERLACVPISFFISCSTNFNVKSEQFVSSYYVFFSSGFRFHCGTIWSHHLWNDFQVLWLLKFKSLFPSSLSSSIVFFFLSLSLSVCVFVYV